MEREYVTYKHKSYRLRLIDFGVDWGGYRIGSAQLGAIVWKDETGWPSSEAQRVDQLIFFYIPTHWFKLSDGKLRDMIIANL